MSEVEKAAVDQSGESSIDYKAMYEAAHPNAEKNVDRAEAMAHGVNDAKNEVQKLHDQQDYFARQADYKRFGAPDGQPVSNLDADMLLHAAKLTDGYRKTAIEKLETAEADAAAKYDQEHGEAA